MMKLKPTSRLGKRLVERKGTTIVGSRDQVPRSENDRASHADQIGVTKGEPVMILKGPRKGALGTIGWIGVAERGGGPRVRVDMGRDGSIFLDADDVMNALVARRRFARGP